MLENPFNEMSKAISFYTNSVDESRLLKIIEKYSLKNQKNISKSNKASVNFVRKGIAGDWKNHFNDESKSLMNKYVGNKAKDFGYDINS